MTRIRDIARILGRTEATNTTNTALGTGSGNLEVYQTLDNLPSTNLTSGDQAWIESSGRLYISNGSGWYNVALINASPSLTLDQSGTIQLNADTLTVTVIASATDSDDNQDMITFSVESDGNMVGTGTTISQDSSVFTITADSEGGTGVAGDFTLTFKATDGIAVDNEALSFSLTFSPIVDSSSATVLLLKADGNGVRNNTHTYLDSANSDGIEFSRFGAPQSSTFTPYRAGGYSTFAVQADQIVFGADADFNFGSGDFTIEYWIYPKGDPAVTVGMPDMRPASTNGAYIGVFINTSNQVSLYVNQSNRISPSASTQLNSYEWNHVCIERYGSTTTMYLDGVSVGTWSDSTTYVQGRCVINGHSYTGANVGYANGCFIKDFRIKKGTAVYQGAFTPPTAPLTSDDNTSLLACALPYHADKSSNDHTPTITTNPETQPFGPYDYEPWVANDHGGSLYSDGTGDYLRTASGLGIGNFGTGDFTVECWWRPAVDPSSENDTFVASTDGGSSTTSWQLYYSTDKFRYAKGTTNHDTTTGLGQKDVWHHVVLQRKSSVTQMWVNGVRRLTNIADTQNFSTNDNILIGANRGLTQSVNGHLADVKITKGTALYTVGDTITVPTEPATFDTNTKLIMNNKTDAKIYDASGANTAKTASTNSSTAQRKFTTSSSWYHSGGTGKNIEIPADDFLRIGKADYTVEFWVYPTSTASGTQSMATYAGGAGFTNGNDYQSFQVARDGQNIKVNVQSGSSSWATAYTSTGNELSANTWHHVALAREGSANRIFVDGALLSTITSDFNFTNTNGVLSLMGRNRNSQFWDGGYMQDFRLTIGKARYTAAFTVPAATFEL